MGSVRKDSIAIFEDNELTHATQAPSEEMQRCLDEVLEVLRKYPLGMTLCLASDQESALLYRIPEWCAVSMRENGPEVNDDLLWETDDLGLLILRTYHMSNALREMTQRIANESARIDDFVRDLGQHLLDPDNKPH